MSKQVLTVEQMQHLQELGLELKRTLLYYFSSEQLTDNQWDLYYPEEGSIIKDDQYYKFLPAYTLLDVLDVLPKCIEGITKDWLLETGVYLDELYWYAAYIDFRCKNTLRLELQDELIDAAYELLCWAVKNGYKEINKTK